MTNLLGGLLQAAGILIAGASGLCSLVFVVTMLLQFSADGDPLGFLLMVALIGGVPFMIGVGLFRWGRAISERAERDGENMRGS